MRGIEAALKVYGESRGGAFAAEALRRVYDDIRDTDRPLAATLIYSALRRQGLWRHLLETYSRRSVRDMPEFVENALIVGIAGVMELKYFAMPVLVNGIVEAVKNEGCDRDLGLVNAVLHTVAREGAAELERLKRSGALRDQALYYGVPGWAASQWSKELSIASAKKLVRMTGMKTYMSLRVSRGTDRAEWIERYRAAGGRCWESPALDCSVRTASNPYPPELPGFADGEITPQSESSMAVGRIIAENMRGGLILDMCCGRGIKTGQMADLMPDCEIEAWDLSSARINAAERELERVKRRASVKFKAGDSLELKPERAPSVILLDAPCSGSGTWGRHPEGKWRATPELITENSRLQKRLLGRAADLVAPGGIILYSTCSLFRDENEMVAASVLGARRDFMEIPIKEANIPTLRGKPYGTIILPGLPWVDGFYAALLAKRR
jgi:16S rRNA (cytosine967-C5)-methyltransferase